ncbi:DUF3742 family protein [Pseudomonas gingeri]|uniref:cold-shock protein n=1 Tax=Pseudomonas gingeri TaxID=117681 RepID=UPI0015A304F1|nr:DUF3742 family protein [Pseudomonas gingeri]NWA28561.1 DUF3742 family protein [Pseudomonas gingeri]
MEREHRTAGSTAGVVTHVVPIGEYGFIKGEDGEQYFFHLQDVEGRASLATGQNVTFTPTSSAKGLKAKRVIPGLGPTTIYVDPNDFVWSKGGPPKGMRTVLITGKGWSRSSDPNEARRLLIETARKWGANAVLQASLSKYTEEEAGSNYRYTMHRFDAQFAVVKAIRTTSDPQLVADSKAQMQALQEWWRRRNAQPLEDEIKNQGPAYRIGNWLGRFSGRYLRSEVIAVSWLKNKGLPAILAAVLKWSARLFFVGVFLYFAFWVAVLMIGLLALGSIWRDEPDAGGEAVPLDPNEVCLDPYSSENLNDPKFCRDE